MDKLKSEHINGWKITLDDGYFLEARYREGFKAILDSIGADIDEGFILSGCAAVQDGDNYDISAGWIVIQGEIYKVDAHTAEGPLGGGEQWLWTTTETDDTTGPSSSSDFDDNPFFKRKTRRAVVIADTPGGDYLPMQCKTLVQRIREKGNTSWTNVALPGAYTGEMKYRLESGLVRLRGTIYTNGASQTINLPAGYRPEHGMTYHCIGIENATGVLANLEAAMASYVELSSTGNLSFQSALPGHDYKIYLDNIPPYKPA